MAKISGKCIGNSNMTLGEFRKATKDLPDDYKINIYWDSNLRGWTSIWKDKKTIFFGEYDGEIIEEEI